MRADRSATDRVAFRARAEHKLRANAAAPSFPALDADLLSQYLCQLVGNDPRYQICSYSRREWSNPDNRLAWITLRRCYG
jgi:hypothetical protein